MASHTGDPNFCDYGLPYRWLPYSWEYSHPLQGVSIFTREAPYSVLLGVHSPGKMETWGSHFRGSPFSHDTWGQLILLAKILLSIYPWRFFKDYKLNNSLRHLISSPLLPFLFQGLQLEIVRDVSPCNSTHFWALFTHSLTTLIWRVGPPPTKHSQYQDACTSTYCAYAAFDAVSQRETRHKKSLFKAPLMSGPKPGTFMAGISGVCFPDKG